MTTPKYGTGEHSENQVNGEVTANSAYRRIESLATLEVLDRDLTTPPGSPANGDTYIVGASATGAWASKDGQIAFYQDGWLFATPKGGMTAFIKDEKQWWGYSSVESEWHPLQDIWAATEHWTGKYNGSSKVYSKALTGITGPGISATVNTAHGISSLTLSKRTVFNICWYHNSGGYSAFPAPSAQIQHTIDGTNFGLTDITAAIDWSIFRCDVRLEYCKT